MSAPAAGPTTAGPGQMVAGSLRLFAAEAIGLPTGLITLAYLARRLGAAEFGLYALAFALVAIAQLVLVALIARTAARFVSQADDWRPVGATVVRQYAAAGLLAFAVLVASAPLIAAALGLPALSPVLRLFALDLIPFALTRGHRDLFVGTGQFGRRAGAAAVGLVSRMALTVLAVAIHPSAAAAAWGMVGGTAIEFAYCRRYIRPRMFGRVPLLVPGMHAYVTPLFLAALAELFLARIDVIMLGWMGASASEIGLYGGAQRLSFVPGLVAMAITPPLLATLGLMLRDGQAATAARLAENAIRVSLLFLPGAALVAGASAEFAALVLGADFRAAGPVLGLLFLASVARVLVAVGHTILVAAERPRWTAAMAIPAVAAATAGYVLVVPRAGGVGVAAVTLGVTVGLAVAALVAIHSVWRIPAVARTLLRSLVVSAGVYGLARIWPAEGALLVLEATLVTLAIPVLYLVLGEWTRDELTTLCAYMGRATLRSGPAA